MNGWNKEVITEICSLIVDCVNRTAPVVDYTTEYKMIRTSNVKDGEIELNGVRYVSEDTFSIWNRRATPQINDVILTREAPHGEVGIIRTNDKVFLGQRLMLYRTDEKKCDPRFLYYSFLTKFCKDQFDKYAAGSTVQHIKVPDAKKFIIPLPPLLIQRRIADILGRYDALIENYQRQISTLEDMAQELYREWFVRGRCPHTELDEDGGLPVGWERKTLGDIAFDARQIVRIEKLNPNTPYVGLEHLSTKSIVIKNSGTIEDVDSDKLLFRENDILFGKIRAYLHKVCISHFDGACSSDTIVIRPKINYGLGFVLFTVFSDHFIEFADKVSNGTKMPRSEWKALKTYSIVVPTEKELRVFDEITAPIFKKMFNLQTQLTTLRQTRDVILPRLLSGQLGVEISTL